MSPDTYLKHLEAFGLLAEGSSFFFAWQWTTKRLPWRIDGDGCRGVWAGAGSQLGGGEGGGGFPQMPSPRFQPPKTSPALARLGAALAGWGSSLRRRQRGGRRELLAVVQTCPLPSAVGAGLFWFFFACWCCGLLVLVQNMEQDAWRSPSCGAAAGPALPQVRLVWSKPRGAPARCSPAWWLWSPCSTTALGVQLLGCLVAADCGLSSAEGLLEASRCSSSLGMLGAKVLRSQKRPRPVGMELVGAGCGGSGVGCPLPSC